MLFLQVSRHQVLRPDEGEAGPHGGRGGLRLHQRQLRRRVQGAQTVDMHSGRIYIFLLLFRNNVLFIKTFIRPMCKLFYIQVELRFQHFIYYINRNIFFLLNVIESFTPFSCSIKIQYRQNKYIFTYNK